jgi:hypothetical protein
VGDERSARGADVNPSLRAQFAERGGDRVAIDAERQSERTRAGQTLAAAQPSALDVVGDGTRDPHEERIAPVAVVDGQNGLPAAHWRV